MKLVYAEFVGYADILAGTGKKKLILDLNKSHNRITLIVGPNGSGKTAIMSKLHPFAFTIGDSRSGKGIMVEGSAGYKEMRYIEKNNEYVVKHYINEKGSVKSYISENGEELNPNGNVTSFKEIVESVLYITEDRMKLMRLGANSSTFIKMSSTERKSFTGELLSDIDVYARMYRKINDDYRVLRGLIKNVTGKIESLNLGDLASIEVRLMSLDETIEELNSQRDKNLLSLGHIQSQLSDLTDEKMFHLETELRTLLNEKADLEVQLESIKGWDLKQLMKRLDEFRVNQSELEKSIINTDASIVNNKDKINNAMNEIDELTAKLSMIQSKNEVGTLSQMLLSIDEKITDLEERFKNFNTSATLEDFKRLLDIYKDIDSKVAMTHSFDHNVIQKIIKLEREGVRVESHLNDELKRRHNEVEQLKAQILASRNRGAVEGKQYMIFKDSKCNCTCPFEEFYDEIMNSNKKDEKDIQKDLRIAEHKLDLMDDKFAVASNLNLIKMILDANKGMIQRLPAGMISLDKIMDAIYYSQPVYDEEYITKFITFMEDYEHIHSLRERRLEIKEELNRIRGNNDTITYLNDELIKRRSLIDVTNEQVRSLEDVKNSLHDDKYLVDEHVTEIEQNINILHSLAHISSRDIEVKKRIQEIQDLMEKRSDLVKKETQHQIISREVDSNLGFHTKQREELTRRMQALKGYQEELVTLEDKYQKITLIREALSSTKGIPLVYIRLYMMDINAHINKILRQIYGDSLEIKEFIIDEKEFRIPYVKNGVLVPDISMVSQGEETFLSLAFSSAFKRREMGGYNIYTFDELDGPLDYGKRDRFNQTLEQELDEVMSEQAFIISHSNAFENYPVDIILMNNEFDISGYTNANVVYIN